MRALVFGLFLAVAVLSGRGIAAEPNDAIRSVIERQLSAFQSNDMATAFGFAAPSIQRKFGNPANFGQMVEQGYPMVWRPSRYEIGELLETDAGWVQLVVFEDASGRLHEAGYLMREIDGAWRIAGVRLRALPEVGA